MRYLPKFKGYTVDFRLNEFRKVDFDEWPEFISFNCPEGQQLFKEFVATPKGQREIENFRRIRFAEKGHQLD